MAGILITCPPMTRDDTGFVVEFFHQYFKVYVAFDELESMQYILPVFQCVPKSRVWGFLEWQGIKDSCGRGRSNLCTLFKLLVHKHKWWHPVLSGWKHPPLESTHINHRLSNLYRMRFFKVQQLQHYERHLKSVSNNLFLRLVQDFLLYFSHI